MRHRGRASNLDRRAEMLRILLYAREQLVRDGWVRGEFLADESGAPRRRVDGDPLTICDALNLSPVTVARWEARLLLQRIAGHPDLVAWNAHPYRTARDVEALLDSAIHELGGIPPRERVRDARKPARVHRGGWVITGGLR